MSQKLHKHLSENLMLFMFKLVAGFNNKHNKFTILEQFWNFLKDLIALKFKNDFKYVVWKDQIIFLVI